MPGNIYIYRAGLLQTVDNLSSKSEKLTKIISGYINVHGRINDMYEILLRNMYERMLF